MNKKEYNGWYNYETWAIALWMDNEQGSQEYYNEMARDYKGDVHRLADALKESHESMAEESAPILFEANWMSDLFRAAMSEVNWREIAEHLLDDLEE